MGGGGGSTNTQTIQKSDPWIGQQPYLAQINQAAADLYATNHPQYYPGQSYAGMNPYTNAALQQTANIAYQGSPTTTAANTYLQNQLRAGPDPMNNPYLKGAINQAQNDVMSKVNAQFSGSNYGGSAHEEWLARQLQNAALPTIANAYQQNQVALNQATNLAPNTQAAQYNAPAQLANVGTAYQNEAQQAINDAMARYNYNQNSPYDALARYGNIVSGNYGGVTTTNSQQPYYTNPLSSAMGLGLGGLSLYNGLSNAGLFGGLGGAASAGVDAGLLSALAGGVGAAGAAGGGAAAASAMIPLMFI